METLRPTPKHRKQRLLISREEADELYLTRGLSLSEIGKIKGVHPNLVREDLVWMGIKIRTLAETNALRSKALGTNYSYSQERDPLLDALAVGIWLGEGDKTDTGKLGIANTNPSIISAWVRFLKIVCGVPEDKIHFRINLCDKYPKEQAIEFWMGETWQGANIGVYLIKQNSRYKHGVLRVWVYSASLFRSVKLRAMELTGRDF